VKVAASIVNYANCAGYAIVFGNDVCMNDIRLMKPLSLFIIILLLAGSRTFGQAGSADSSIYSCEITSFPSVRFAKNSAHLTKEAAAMLHKIGDTLINHPRCNIKVTACSLFKYKNQQLAWNRQNAISMYLVEKLGVAASRIISKYNDECTTDIVTLEPIAESEAGSVPRQ